MYFIVRDWTKKVFIKNSASFYKLGRAAKSGQAIRFKSSLRCGLSAAILRATRFDATCALSAKPPRND
jgi:hypothetical protein